MTFLTKSRKSLLCTSPSGTSCGICCTGSSYLQNCQAFCRSNAPLLLESFLMSSCFPCPSSLWGMPRGCQLSGTCRDMLSCCIDQNSENMNVHHRDKSKNKHATIRISILSLTLPVPASIEMPCGCIHSMIECCDIPHCSGIHLGTQQGCYLHLW